ncbi:hypothetical protein K439DRAFT_1620204 [Ramaria rubella]|nr:hypothetical protein K439DRAFT_1620204 [Ramaria rubella]
MERYCGKLGARITSRPSIRNLAVYMKRTAQLSQLKVCYSRVWVHLMTDPPEDPTIREQIYPEYLLSILHSPHTRSHRPEVDVSPKIAQYFTAIYSCRWRDVQQIFPESIRWGKVHIANGGDKIRQLLQSYELIVKNPRPCCGQPTEYTQTFYGQLQYIIKIEMPRSNKLGITEARRHLLALVKPCTTGNKDATVEVTTYTQTMSSIFIDLQAIGAVIGRIKHGNEWAIIDRSGDLARRP